MDPVKLHRGIWSLTLGMAMLALQQGDMGFSVPANDQVVLESFSAE